MNKLLTILISLLMLGSVLAINPNQPYTPGSVIDANTMGAMLVQEWAFGSIDLAFLILSVITSIILLRYALPVSTIAISVMAFATVFAFGFNSIFAWGILITGIVALSLMIVVNLLLKTQY